MTDRQTLLAEAGDLDWFHAMDLGEAQTPGRFAPGTPQNRTLYGVMSMLNGIDLEGLACLDVGTADGLIAFNMARRGAGRVVATDLPSEGRPSFRLARTLLGLEEDVELVGSTSFDNIVDRLGEQTFDVVVCAGVMYHMIHPFDAIIKARRLLRRNGLLVFQTRYHPEEDRPILDFNLGSGRLDQTNVFWVPSKSAVTGMLSLAGFQLLSIRTGTRHSFIATISKNVDLEEITQGPDLVLRQHEKGMAFTGISPTIKGEPSTASYEGARIESVIDDHEFVPDFPPHPVEDKPVVGSSYHKTFNA